jgi:putative colanic acid biosynthesis UDP-glucose lipid carrier transferase
MAFRIADNFWIVSSILVVTWVNDCPWNPHFSFFTVCAMVLFYFMARANGLYKSWRVTSLWRETETVIVVWVCVAFLVLFIVFLMKLPDIHLRRVFVSWFVLAQIMLILWRVLLRVALREYRSRGRNYRTVVIAGAGELGTRLARTILDAPWMGYRIKGFYDDNKEAGSMPLPGSGIRVLGDLDRMIEDVRTERMDLVYIALPMRFEGKIRKVLKGLSNTAVSAYLAPDFLTFDILHARMVDMNGIPTISIYEDPFDSASGWLKRLEDVVVSSLILVMISPVMMAIAAAIKLTSPGPVFFKQRRYGARGDEIMVWKFRTMTVIEDGDVIRQASKNDARVTKVGAFLRRTSLDELPQFINVLQGTMSIVGPRPHATAHNEYYRNIIPGYMLRHKVKPGITGWAQINGYRGETDTLEKMEKRVEYDLRYIKNWSFWFDIKIIFATVFKGFVDKNAY